MAPPLSLTVDTRDHRAVVAVHGELDRAGTAPLFATLMKCLAEQPNALLVDLAGMTLAEDTSLAIFTAVVRQAALWPDTPVLLCAPPTARTAALLARGRLTVHRSVAAAVRSLETHQARPLTIAEELLPVAGAARRARDIVTEALSRWNLPHLIGPASLVASELVTNAAEHAGTMMTLRITHQRRRVHIAVRDGSPQEAKLKPPADPRVPGGRGLLLVAGIAAGWGCLPCRDGKVVWAVLTANP